MFYWSRNAVLTVFSFQICCLCPSTGNSIFISNDCCSSHAFLLLGKKCTYSIYFFLLKRQIMFILFLLMSSHPEHLPVVVKISREDDCGPVVFMIEMIYSSIERMLTNMATVVYNVFVFSESVKVCTNWRSCFSVFWDRSKWRNRCFIQTCSWFWNHLCNVCTEASYTCICRLESQCSLKCFNKYW